jgi:hypothetical protein
METKLIGGVRHVRVRCVKCGQPIWVSDARVDPDGRHDEDCSDCNSRHRSRREVERGDVSLGDLRYNGSSF